MTPSKITSPKGFIECGKTNHVYIVDLAVGISTQYLKICSLYKSERKVKFNRFIEIDDIINPK
jgi:enolase